MLTLGDLVQEWRDGRLLRPRGSDSKVTAQQTGTSSSGSATSSALPAQELDPAGAARALRILFERVRLGGKSTKAFDALLFRQAVTSPRRSRCYLLNLTQHGDRLDTEEVCSVCASGDRLSLCEMFWNSVLAHRQTNLVARLASSKCSGIVHYIVTQTQTNP